jgi:enoyl-CoA hydratase/carnithine racemase
MEAKTYETPEYEKSHGRRVVTIWLNRPEVLNCINSTLARERIEALQRAAADEEVRTIVIRGRGRAFCAGRDLKELNAGALGNQAESWKIVRSSGLLALSNDWLIPKPTIAVVRGFAIAGGVRDDGRLNRVAALDRWHDRPGEGRHAPACRRCLRSPAVPASVRSDRS